MPFSILILACCLIRNLSAQHFIFRNRKNLPHGFPKVIGWFFILCRFRHAATIRYKFSACNAARIALALVSDTHSQPEQHKWSAALAEPSCNIELKEGVGIDRGK
jgi:hypothetical protein